MRFLNHPTRVASYADGDDLLNFASLLSCYLQRKGSISFVQIGGNDGKYVDPLHDFIIENDERLQGLIVEPMTRAYVELKETYKDYPAIRTIKAAIHNEKKTATLYQIDPERLQELPEFYKGVASFFRPHFEKTQTPGEFIVEEEVTCYTLVDLLKEFAMQDLDLLQIDAEGYDAEIIGNLNFDTLMPRILRFEHGLPQEIMSRKELDGIVSRLNGAGYQVVCEEYDAVAFRIDDFI